MHRCQAIAKLEACGKRNLSQLEQKLPPLPPLHHRPHKREPKCQKSIGRPREKSRSPEEERKGPDGGKGEDVADEGDGIKGEWRDKKRVGRRTQWSGEPRRVEEVEDEAADRAGDGEEE